MPNITQQNPYHDKLAQILSQQVLADFDNFSMEETSEDYVLHIPKSFFISQKIAQTTDDKTTVELMSLTEKREKFAQLAGSCNGDLPIRMQPLASERVELL